MPWIMLLLCLPRPALRPRCLPLRGCSLELVCHGGSGRLNHHLLWTCQHERHSVSMRMGMQCSEGSCRTTYHMPTWTAGPLPAVQTLCLTSVKTMGSSSLY